MSEPQVPSLVQIASKTKYPVAAFHFVRQGLDYTVHQLFENPESMDEMDRHVSGAQLSKGLRDYAVEQYGCLAATMMERWHIQRTEDFGKIVFAMVDSGLMQATERDSIHDFEDGFDFATAFDVPVNLEKVGMTDPHTHIGEPEHD